MTQTANSARISVEALRAALTSLTRLEGRWRKSGSKTALYRYLTAVFDLYAEWKRAGSARVPANRVVRFAGLTRKSDRHPLRILIDATSTADRKSKSRWTQALRFAWRERHQWRDLEQYLCGSGGISVSASKWAEQNAWKRTPPGYVRIGGNHFPLVPLFVDVKLLDRYGDYAP
jgi:hypothetical protein